MTAARLSKDLWIQAGFEALLAQGPSALKAEALARGLKTTKGSFYWHFKDVPAFHGEMLEKWEAASLAHFEDAAAQDGTPVQRLRQIAQVECNTDGDSTVFNGAAEPAIRAWARDNAQAAETLARVDQRRMDELDRLLAEIGLSNPELSRILYAARLGMAELSGRDGQENDDALGTLVDLILALYG